jgi:DNA-binding CsgD family transcriptional regulator
MNPLTVSPSRSRVLALSLREATILRLSADGLATQEIARRLNIAPGTVKTHFQRIFAKLGVHGCAAAVAVGLRQGLIL